VGGTGGRFDTIGSVVNAGGEGLIGASDTGLRSDLTDMASSGDLETYESRSIVGFSLASDVMMILRAERKRSDVVTESLVRRVVSIGSRNDPVCS